MQVYELIACVRRANENAGNLISVVQFLINICMYMYMYMYIYIAICKNFESSRIYIYIYLYLGVHLFSGAIFRKCCFPCDISMELPSRCESCM